jgi:hypothetical protein
MPPPGQKKPNPQKKSEKAAKEAHKAAVANGTYVEKKVCAHGTLDFFKLRRLHLFFIQSLDFHCYFCKLSLRLVRSSRTPS